MPQIVLSLFELLETIQAENPGLIGSIDTLRRRIDAMERAGIIAIQRVGLARAVYRDDVPKIVEEIRRKRNAPQKSRN